MLPKFELEDELFVTTVLLLRVLVRVLLLLLLWTVTFTAAVPRTASARAGRMRRSQGQWLHPARRVRRLANSHAVRGACATGADGGARRRTSCTRSSITDSKRGAWGAVAL